MLHSEECSDVEQESQEKRRQLSLENINPSYWDDEALQNALESLDLEEFKRAIGKRPTLTALYQAMKILKGRKYCQVCHETKPGGEMLSRSKLNLSCMLACKI